MNIMAPVMYYVLACGVDFQVLNRLMPQCILTSTARLARLELPISYPPTAPIAPLYTKSKERSATQLFHEESLSEEHGKKNELSSSSGPFAAR